MGGLMNGLPSSVTSALDISFSWLAIRTATSYGTRRLLHVSVLCSRASTLSHPCCMVIFGRGTLEVRMGNQQSMIHPFTGGIMRPNGACLGVHHLGNPFGTVTVR